MRVHRRHRTAVSSLSLSFTCRKKTFVARGPSLPHPSPPVHCGIFSNAGTEVGGVGKVGKEILHHAEKAHPSRPGPERRVCANNSAESDSMYAQVLSGRSQIHPELSKATDEWLELSVFGGFFPAKRKHIYYASPLQAVQIKKSGRQRGKINRGGWGGHVTVGKTKNGDR